MSRLTALFLLWLALPLSAAAGSRMQAAPADDGKYVSEVKLIGGSAGEVSSLKANAERKGWTVIESNLNAGAGGDVIYLCYKTSRDGDYITGLYLSSAGNSGLANSITVGGKRYTLCPYEGGGHFTGIKGDLNSNAGGDDIHIYYTKDSFSDNRAVTEIWFNATSKGAVCKDNSSTPYDVNKGAGGDDIFMHFSTTAGASVEKPAASGEGKSEGKSGGKATVGKAISEVKLIGGSSSEINSLKSNAERQGWTVIGNNLNAGTRGDVIYLCYKTAKGGDYITGLYLSSAGNSGLANSITVGGKRYTLCPYEGGSHFTGIKGDLNSNAGGDDIHIYYTKDSFGDNRAVTEIWFNATSKGAVCKDNGSTPYDVNSGAGGSNIFMHFSTTAGTSAEKPAASNEGKSGGKSTVGKAISEVKLIGGSAGEISSLKANAERKGWTVIESNLNAGAGGDVIYLCYKTSRDGDYITGLYLSSAGNSGLANSITVGGKRYTLCPYEGGSHFTGIKGDLNSNAGGDDIHIFYTKDSFSDNRAVTGIWFNATSKGAVCKDNSSTPYDVNKGAGGDDIFMHYSTEK